MTTRHKVCISDIGQVFDGPHATPKTIDEGPLFLGITSLNAGRLDLSSTRHVSEDDFAKWTKRVQPMAGDVVFSYETKIGEAALIPAGLKCCLGRRMGLVRLDPSKCDPRYFLYQYLSPEYQQFLASRTVHGATVDRLLLKDFPSFEFPLPPLPEQREIAAILGALDDKIELNRKTAATLEAMARALYRSWFVDFDPVWAKTEGRTPAHMDAATAALFPDSFGDDGLPVGWETQPLLDQSYWVNGAAYKDMHFSDAPDALPVIKIAELKAGITRGTKFTATDLGEKFRIARGELLFSWSGNPDTSIDAFIWPFEEAWLNQHIFAVRPNGHMSKAMLFVCLRFFKPEMAEIARNKQTTGLGHITRKDLEVFSVSVAPAPVMSAFDRSIVPFFDRYSECLFENQTLKELRDTLLPKLMSGELRVREAQELVEEVA